MWIWGTRGFRRRGQDLDRQVDALQAVGIDPARIYLDKKSGSTVERPGLRAVTGYARVGDVDRRAHPGPVGRTVRDTLNLIHELTERGVGVRNLADPIKVDSANPADPMAQLAVVLLALFRPNGADLHVGTGGARQSRGHCQGPARRPPLRGSTRTSSTTPAGYGTKGKPSRRS